MVVQATLRILPFYHIFYAGGGWCAAGEAEVCDRFFLSERYVKRQISGIYKVQGNLGTPL